LIGFTEYREKLEKLRDATARSLSMVELAIAWLLSEPAVASVIAGATSAERLHKMQLRRGKQVSALDRMELGRLLGAKCSRGELTYPR
jgi:aryl-alcohol dehydrogenase-like predicted oxidoreductase